ncbi:MAG: hypothetical protein ACI837_003005 [Crocinitomicaceae bacterium]|jgi:hypothetical protein
MESHIVNEFLRKYEKIELFLVVLFPVLAILKFTDTFVHPVPLIFCGATLSQFSFLKTRKAGPSDRGALAIFFSKTLLTSLCLGYVTVLFQIQAWPSWQGMSYGFLLSSIIGVVGVLFVVKKPISQFLSKLELIQLIGLFSYLIVIRIY